MDRCATALKEWAVVVDALRRGEQMVLLRKGGILDVGGEFRLETERFLLWPTYLHQSADWLAEAHQDRLAPVLAEPRAADEYRLDTFAEVERVLEVPSRQALDHLSNEHLWSPAYLDLRWRYRPELPLYLLILRAWRLPDPVIVHETTEQSGCRSWVPLREPVSLTGRRPVLDGATFRRRADDLTARLS